jgi:hypothetical protein
VHSDRISDSGAAPSNETLIPELFSADNVASTTPKIIKSAQLGIPATASEGLAIDTLAMIFEAIFSDPKLPDALKAAISSLQITLLKVAMKDTSLFTDSSHPARQVLDRMGHAVLGLPADVAARHPACARLFEIAGQLRSAPSIDNAMSTDALAKLDALIASRNAELSTGVEACLPLLRLVDRGDEAAVAARQVIDRFIERNPPPAIVKFINTTWHKVLQQVWLDHGPNCLKIQVLRIKFPGFQMDIKKVLLLGGSGFVGTYIANRLSQRGIEVTVPTRRRERTKALIIQPGVEMPEADINCEKTLVELMRARMR